MSAGWKAAILAGLVCLACAEQATVYYSIQSSSYYAKDGPPDTKGDVVAATGSYSDLINTTGWGMLRLHGVSSASTGDTGQAYAVGMLEAYFTHQRIFQMWTNYRNHEYASQNATPSSKLLSFMSAQMEWVRHEAATNTSSPYWRDVSYIMAQFDGLVKGYSLYAPSGSSMTEMELYLLTAAGDLETLNSLFPASNSGPARRRPIPQADLLTDCSGFIKLTDDDVLFGHSTWRYYYAMLRIYKYYTFDFTTGHHECAFSSSPGFLSSKDDYYVTGRGLLVMETTNSVFNGSLYKYISPSTMLVWQRAILANWQAHNPEEWVTVFAQHNSGTYNNQWMVLDSQSARDALSKRHTLYPGTLWILEQIPGYTHSADVTSILGRQHYWPSYNIPYFIDIFNISGYPAMVQQYGDAFTYSSCPRARIFARNASEIVDLTSMKALMQYNDYQNDPLSLNRPSNAVASRYDLTNPNFGSSAPFGAVDSKVTSAKLVTSKGGSLCSAIISGPTHQQQPPFVWSQTPWMNVSHTGLPDRWDFDWVTTCL